MKYTQIILLILIIILAFFLRFYKVTEIPPSLNWDEVSIGYNAYSILKTNRDEWNVFLPVHFKAYGEYKLPAQIYASIPGIAIFGLNAFGVRITPVIYGSLTILLLFFLTRTLFKNDYIALLSAFLLAISPWHIQLTRASFESSFATFWLVMGIWLLTKGFTQKKYLILSMIPFAISIFTYNSTRIFTPLFLIAIAIIYRKSLRQFKEAVLFSGIVFAILMVPLLPSLFSGERSARYKLVSITDDLGLNPRINQNRGSSTLPPPLPILIHNKFTYVGFYFGKNYLTHFSPDFLFIAGAPHKQHHIQGMGELYWAQAPFLILGLYFLFKRKEKYRGLLTSWALLSFVPVSITNDSIPHALRTLIACPFYQIVTAYGVVLTSKALSESRPNSLWWNPLREKSSIIIIFLSSGFLVLQFFYYLHLYYQVYPINYSRDWQYGYKQVVSYIKDHQDQYDEIVFSRHFGEPHEFTLFFLNHPPEKYQNSSNLVRFETHDWVWVLRFDKYYFPDLGDAGTRYQDILKQEKGKKLLFIGKSGDFPASVPKLLSVNFLNGEKAFDIVENK